jgi:hypothetical protein
MEESNFVVPKEGLNDAVVELGCSKGGKDRLSVITLQIYTYLKARP